MYSQQYDPRFLRAAQAILKMETQLKRLLHKVNPDYISHRTEVIDRLFKHHIKATQKLSALLKRHQLVPDGSSLWCTSYNAGLECVLYSAKTIGLPKPTIDTLSLKSIHRLETLLCRKYEYALVHASKLDYPVLNYLYQNVAGLTQHLE
jgi:hypothetical protein